VQEKNIPFLLDLMAQLPAHEFHLTLAGYGSEYAALQDYAYTVKKLSREQIRFIENPSKQLLVKLYRTAHIFVFASQSETQGLVLAEAMAQGTPVVALDGPGQRDIIKNGYNGFLVHDHTEMKDILERIKADEKLCDVLQNNAQKTAEHYTAEYSVRKLIEFYYAVIAKTQNKLINHL
jgi:1,2-diacylglycerol 3-alpha-glucosyltransferase